MASQKVRWLWGVLVTISVVGTGAGFSRTYPPAVRHVFVQKSERLGCPSEEPGIHSALTWLYRIWSLFLKILTFLKRKRIWKTWKIVKIEKIRIPGKNQGDLNKFLQRYLLRSISIRTGSVAVRSPAKAKIFGTFPPSFTHISMEAGNLLAGPPELGGVFGHP